MKKYKRYILILLYSIMPYIINWGYLNDPNISHWDTVTICNTIGFTIMFCIFGFIFTDKYEN